jgi:hypothetical protein
MAHARRVLGLAMAALAVLMITVPGPAALRSAAMV